MLSKAHNIDSAHQAKFSGLQYDESQLELLVHLPLTACIAPSAQDLKSAQRETSSLLDAFFNLNSREKVTLQDGTTIDLAYAQALRAEWPTVLQSLDSISQRLNKASGERVDLRGELERVFFDGQLPNHRQSYLASLARIDVNLSREKNRVDYSAQRSRVKLDRAVLEKFETLLPRAFKEASDFLSKYYSLFNIEWVPPVQSVSYINHYKALGLCYLLSKRVSISPQKLDGVTDENFIAGFVSVVVHELVHASGGISYDLDPDSKHSYIKARSGLVEIRNKRIFGSLWEEVTTSMTQSAYLDGTNSNPTLSSDIVFLQEIKIPRHLSKLLEEKLKELCKIDYYQENPAQMQVGTVLNPSEDTDLDSPPMTAAATTAKIFTFYPPRVSVRFCGYQRELAAVLILAKELYPNLNPEDAQLKLRSELTTAHYYADDTNFKQRVTSVFGSRFWSLASNMTVPERLKAFGQCPQNLMLSLFAMAGAYPEPKRATLREAILDCWTILVRDRSRQKH
jgi:hypothetical protein